VPADPDSLTVARCPVSRPPDVIGPPDVIAGAMRVIRPIANLDRDGAWGGDIARGTGITGSVWAITRVTGSVCRRTSIIISASACTDRHRKEKEQENRPFWSGFRSIPGGDPLRFRVINNVHFHIIIYGLDRAFTRLNSTTSAWIRNRLRLAPARAAADLGLVGQRQLNHTEEGCLGILTAGYLL
jgi:hypothetical protein